jgi:hypothetical protein
MRLFDHYVQAAGVSGRSLASLMTEALKLRLSHTRLGFSEYIDFQLYRDDLTFAEKSQFGGQRTQQVLEDILIDDYSRFLSLDKISMYALMRGHGLPIPTVRASYRAMRPAHLPSLQTPRELENYLRAPDNLPVYIKRAFGAYGRGNTLVQRLEGDLVVLGNGNLEPVASFCQSLDGERALGWVLQDPLSAHADIRELTQSDKISGLRIHTFFPSSR